MAFLCYLMCSVNFHNIVALPFPFKIEPLIPAICFCVLSELIFFCPIEVNVQSSWITDCFFAVAVYSKGTESKIGVPIVIDMDKEQIIYRNLFEHAHLLCNIRYMCNV